MGERKGVGGGEERESMAQDESMAEGADERDATIADGGGERDERMVLVEEAPCGSELEEERNREEESKAPFSPPPPVARFGASQIAASSTVREPFEGGGSASGVPVPFGASAFAASSGGCRSAKVVEGGSSMDDQAEWEALALACCPEQASGPLAVPACQGR